MTSNTTLLITGANRGIGKGLVQHYLSQPNYTVIAAVRNLNDKASKVLFDLPKGKGSSLITIKIDSSSPTDPVTAVEELKSAHGITALDIVVANAGISKIFPPVSEVKVSDMKEHFEVNLFGVVLLFQAVLPLLNQAKTPRFFTMSSGAGSMGLMPTINIPNAAYGPSKAALNYITLKIHLENPNITAVPLDPGWVQTDMGNAGAVALGFEKATITLDESISGLTKVIDTATKEKTSGQFMGYDGNVEPW